MKRVGGLLVPLLITALLAVDPRLALSVASASPGTEAMVREGYDPATSNEVRKYLVKDAQDRATRALQQQGHVVKSFGEPQVSFEKDSAYVFFDLITTKGQLIKLSFKYVWRGQQWQFLSLGSLTGEH